MNALMKVPRLTMFLALFALVPVRAAGECVIFPLATDKKDAGFVFEGTVKQVVPLDGNEVAAEIETHQVWKGKVSATTTAHYVPTMDGPSLKAGERYILFGVRETDRLRKDGALVGEVHKDTIWVPPCSGASRSSPMLVKQLGRSKKPTGVRQ
jgi:hypothetical protein